MTMLDEPGTIEAAPPRPTSPPPRPKRRPRRIRTFTADDWFSLVGALLSSLALVVIGYEHLLDLSGVLGFAVCWYLVFLAVYATLVSISNPRHVVVERLVTVTLWLAASVVILALASTIIYTFVQGFRALDHLNFFTHDMAGVSPTAPLSQGGIKAAMVGTVIEVGIAVVISVPLGIGTAIYMTEVQGRGSQLVRTVVESMTALPEILAGLFVYVVLIVGFGMPKSGLAAAIAMSVTMIPIIARAGEVALRVVPNGLREASAALGANHWSTVRRVVLPSARAGLVTATILAVARGIGETAVVLITSGASSFTTFNPVGEPMNSLPLYIYTMYTTHESVAIARAFGAASVLLGMVLVLFVVARLLVREKGGPAVRRRWGRRPGAVLAGLVAALVLGPLLLAPPAGAASHALINGSGSSWAENAVNQWVADVNSAGIQVVYNPDGDAQGRQDFANKVSDFSVTSDGYQGVDPVTGVSDTSQGRPYAYLPIAAGGTSFPYQIKFDGQQVENLRLSGETLAKIFTNKITNWSDPEITSDNNGHALPSLPIIPVVQSEGSGATQQLTSYFNSQFPSIWQPFAGAKGATEYFPRQGDQIAQNGSNGAMNYVASSSANGSISYVEYSFALSVNYPVVKVLNKAGYFTLPTQYNVAVALEAAQINMDPSSPNYLLQDLTNVYTDVDPRTYPLSSYVYMIEPTGASPAETSETTAKRQSIADFSYYSICQGQKEIGPIGYSPLPVNLVEAGFGQINKLQQADPGVDLTSENIDTCNNPTFVLGQPNTNYLATIAPLPPACDQIGQGPCAAGVTPNGIGATPNTSGSYPGTAAGANGSGGGAGGSGSGGASGASGGAAGGASGSAAAASGAAAGQSNSAASSSSASTTTLPTYDPVTLSDIDLVARLSPLGWAALLLVLAFAVPVILGYRRARLRNRGTS